MYCALTGTSSTNLLQFRGVECLSQSSNTLIMGGTLVDDNFKALDKGAQFIIGTPGRVFDMMKRYVRKQVK